MTTLDASVTWAGKVRALHEGSEDALPRALADVAETLGPNGWALVGGMAAGFHARPRGTQDIDILFADDAALENHVQAMVSSGKFRRHRSHAVEHVASGVEVELLTPGFLNFPAQIARTAIADAQRQAIDDQTLPVVGRDGLVALKLQRRSRADQGDIERVIQAGGAVDLSRYDLSPEQIDLYCEIEKETL